MTKLAASIAELHRSERELGRELRIVAARHRSEQNISHIALDLAGWCDEHIADLAAHGRRYSSRLSAHPGRMHRSPKIQEWLTVALRRRPEPALLLLADLRRVHRLAAGV